MHELQQALKDFIATKPYRINFKLNPEQTFYECRIYSEGRLPPTEIGVLIGEVIYQIRSALDHVIFHFSVEQILQISDPEAKVKAADVPQFPIFDKPNKRLFDRYLKFVEKPVRDAVERYQPYNRTNCPDPVRHPLHLLRRLSNADKHRVTVTTVGSIRVIPGQAIAPGVEIKLGGDVNDGDVVARVPAHLNPKEHFGPNLTAEILLHNPREPASIHPVMTRLGEIYHFVRLEMLPYFSDIAAQLSGGGQ